MAPLPMRKYEVVFLTGHLPVDANAELHRAGAVAGTRDLAEGGRSWTRVRDIEERMIQKVQRYQTQSHPQVLPDADLFVDTHVQNVKVVVPQINKPRELSRCGGRRVE